MKNRIPPPIVMILIGALMWYVANSALALPMNIPRHEIVGGVLIAAGVVLSFVAIGQFKFMGTTVNPLTPSAATRLVDGGIFKLSRNPMYLAMAIMLLGWAVRLQSVTASLGVVLFVTFITIWQIRPEEEAMHTLFAKQFIDYCARVRRWL
jgi:protein-S-isoprenylcysteine O-methyltransferase Ste14